MSQPKLPQVGAALVSCDGTPAEAWAERRVAAFSGLWALESERIYKAPRLFLDEANPFNVEPAACTFESAAGIESFTLEWRPLADPDGARRLADSAASYVAPIELRRFGRRRYWIGLGAFDPHADAELTKLIAQVSRQRDRIRHADLIVLDVRGNGGGSDRWAERLARIIWGAEPVAAAVGRIGGAWRASPDNLSTYERYLAEEIAKPDPEGTYVAELRDFTEQFREALKQGQSLVSSEPTVGAPQTAPPRRPRVLVLTDDACFSACLSGLDLWLEVGATQVGRETGADTMYVESRHVPLPSGYGELLLPMAKVIGRSRGRNQPHVPTHHYDGDMRNTASIQAWVATLPASH